MTESADLLPPGTPVDLDNCAREPIHIPGSVQPRGVLLVVQEPDLRVVQVSANVAELLGVAAEAVLGGPLERAVGPAAGAALARGAAGPALARGAAGFGDLHDRNPVDVVIEVGGRPVAFDAILHRGGHGLLLVELEPAEGPRPFSFPNTYLAVRGTVGELNRASSLSELYDVCARAVRELTGFDRVMVYRYDSEYNGEVVAEAKRADLNSFLGLHYPASDIPAQARALYEKNLIRLISDVGYVAAPLVPTDNPITGQPMDLTHASLRSVSPIHLEYLQNMGVGASMSISLVRDGALWGLIACHHYSGPHLPPYSTRTAAEFLGSALSLRLVDRAQDEELRARLAAQEALTKLTAAMRSDATALAGALLGDGLHGAVAVTDLIAADGVALALGGADRTAGRVPDSAALAGVLAWVAGQDEPVVCTDSLRRSAPHLDLDPAQVSGVLAVVLGDGQYVVLFRAEARRSVDWGGDPHNKAIAVREGDTVRLSPRKSFERWREVVQARSLPWTAAERADALALRQALLEVLYARSERELHLAETMQRSLLPVLPHVPGWSLTATYHPAAGGRIGGDWYDAFPLPGGRLAVVLGDVAGHGVEAAGTMAQVRTALRAYLVDEQEPVAALQRLNAFTRRLLPNAFATVLLVCCDLATGALRAVAAGHPVPMVAGPGIVPAAAAIATSPPVGVGGARYAVSELTLERGQVLVCFSDGLVERRDEDLADSLAGLRAAITALGPTIDAEALSALLRTDAVHDDATVIVVGRDPSP